MTAASIIFDLLMAGLVVAAVFVGRKLGLLRMLFAFGIVFIAVLLARILMPVVTMGVEKMKLYDTVKNASQGRIVEIIEKEGSLDFDGVADKLKLPESVRKRAVGAVEDIAAARGAELSDKLSSFLASMTVKLATYGILVLLVLAALIIISLVTRLVQKIPVLGDINAAGGGIMGVLVGILAVLVICIVAFATGVGKTSGVLAEVASGSLLIKLLNLAGIMGSLV